MSPVKLFTGSVLAGALASVLAIPIAAAQAGTSLRVNGETQTVQAPTQSGAVGISYSTPAGGLTSALKVYTDGFLFCANISSNTVVTTPVSLTLAYEDQSFSPSPAHAWAFPTETDVQTVGFTGGVLSVNYGATGSLLTTLTCYGTDANGVVRSGLTDGIFDSGLESATVTNYTHLVNWSPIPSMGFDWNAPDWTLVPTDPCISTTSQPASVVEDAACAAVSGVRPSTTAVRAGTVWTATDAGNFTYLFRVDARLGAQTTQAPVQFRLPTAAVPQAPADSNAETFVVSDAYDSAFLTGAGEYCFLATLPAALNSGVCSGSTTHTLTGPLSYAFPLTPPPVGTGLATFYVAVKRTIGQSTHANLTTPVVGVSILVDPALVAEGGDKFSGDDVAFGFMPGSTGFPWMIGQ